MISTKNAATRRNLCVTLSAIGSNLPDSDLLYSFFGGKLNYLLHHRGHTHTLIGAVVLAGLMYLAAWAWSTVAKQSAMKLSLRPDASRLEALRL